MHSYGRVAEQAGPGWRRQAGLRQSAGATRAIRPCPSRIYFGRLFYYPKEINYETDNLPQLARSVRCRDNG